MSDVKLLPCPFCGGEAQMWGDASRTYIRCGNDQCIVYTGDPLPYNDVTHVQDAITAWNTRANLASRDAEVEALRKQRDEARRLYFDAVEKLAPKADLAERLAGALRTLVEDTTRDKLNAEARGQKSK